MNNQHSKSRRRFLQLMGLSVSGLANPRLTQAGAGSLMTKPIPSSNEQIPVIGLGSSRTFNVGDDSLGLDNVAEVMRHFFNAGGQLIDSSPMYGSSQSAIGYGLKKLAKSNDVFSADKVWTRNSELGAEQMEQSRQYWKIDSFDLMQVHNLVAGQENIWGPSKITNSVYYRVFTLTLILLFIQHQTQLLSESEFFFLQLLVRHCHENIECLIQIVLVIRIPV
jgi:hypothetical protein